MSAGLWTNGSVVIVFIDVSAEFYSAEAVELKGNEGIRYAHALTLGQSQWSCTVSNSEY